MFKNESQEFHLKQIALCIKNWKGKTTHKPKYHIQGVYTSTTSPSWLPSLGQREHSCTSKPLI